MTWTATVLSLVKLEPADKHDPKCYVTVKINDADHWSFIISCVDHDKFPIDKVFTLTLTPV